MQLKIWKEQNRANKPRFLGPHELILEIPDCPPAVIQSIRESIFFGSVI